LDGGSSEHDAGRRYGSGMINEIKEEISNLMDQHEGSVALLLSGGSDSQLLLAILLELGKRFSIVCFDETFDRKQNKVIDRLVEKHNLAVFSYPPTNAYVIGNGRKTSIVEEYLMSGGELMPFIRDVVHDPSRCAVSDVKFSPFIDSVPAAFSLYLTGIRKTDRHYATGKIAQTKLRKSKSVYFAPLWDLTRKQVQQMSSLYEIETSVDTGIIGMCLNCLCSEKATVFCPKEQIEIDRVDWSPVAMMQAFQEKYGY
jgi:3'-phosphoadenosine 5'-phosphosulfate sulfotransferase (PAPS reductase)/FAD synthetase